MTLPVYNELGAWGALPSVIHQQLHQQHQQEGWQQHQAQYLDAQHQHLQQQHQQQYQQQYQQHYQPIHQHYPQYQQPQDQQQQPQYQQQDQQQQYQQQQPQHQQQDQQEGQQPYLQPFGGSAAHPAPHAATAWQPPLPPQQPPDPPPQPAPAPAQQPESFVRVGGFLLQVVRQGEAAAGPGTPWPPAAAPSAGPQGFGGPWAPAVASGPWDPAAGAGPLPPPPPVPMPDYAAQHAYSAQGWPEGPGTAQHASGASAVLPAAAPVQPAHAGGSGPYAAAAPQAAHAWGPAQHGLPPAPQAQQHGATAPLAAPSPAASLQQAGGPGGGAPPWRQPPPAGQADAGGSSAAAGAAATAVAAAGPAPSAAELVQQLLACLHPGRVLDTPHRALRAKAVLLMEMSAAWDEYERIRSGSGGVQGSSEQEARKQLLLVGRTPAQLDEVFARLFPPHPPGRMSYESPVAMYEAVGGAEAVMKGLRFRSDGRGADTVLAPTVRWGTTERCDALTTLRRALQPMEDLVRRQCGSAQDWGPASAEEGQQAARGDGYGAGPSGGPSTAPDGAPSSGALNSVARRVTGHKRAVPELPEAEAQGFRPAPTAPPPPRELLVPIRQYLRMALAPQIYSKTAPPLPLSDAVDGLKRMAKVPLTPELLRSFGFETVEALLAGALSETVQVRTQPGGGAVLVPSPLYARSTSSYVGLHGNPSGGRGGSGAPPPQAPPQYMRPDRGPIPCRCPEGQCSCGARSAGAAPAPRQYMRPERGPVPCRCPAGQCSCGAGAAQAPQALPVHRVGSVPLPGTAGTGGQEGAGSLRAALSLGAPAAVVPPSTVAAGAPPPWGAAGVGGNIGGSGDAGVKPSGPKGGNARQSELPAHLRPKPQGRS